MKSPRSEGWRRQGKTHHPSARAEPCNRPEDWPWLDQVVLHSSRSRQVFITCIACHFFLHQPGPNCIPLLSFHLHQSLIAHGEHLDHRCNGWTEYLERAGLLELRY